MSSDFDFLIGGWQVFNQKLERWFDQSAQWLEFESHHHEKKRLQGEGTIAHHYYTLQNTVYERNVIRSYNAAQDFWKIDRLDGMSSMIMAPLTGTFWNNKGAFVSKGIWNSADILIWVEWTKICNTYACWEQACSIDKGHSWQTNWVMEFYKA